MKSFRISSPANIALIKYMGKVDPRENLPCHESLSLTLKDLCTEVELRPGDGTEAFCWDEGTRSGFSKAALDRASGHFERVRDLAPDFLGTFGFPTDSSRTFEVSSQNSFPAGAGIASSASSFSALTLASLLSSLETHEEFVERFREDFEFRKAVARLSRKGSGSSCRSFDGPWVKWGSDGIKRLNVNQTFEEVVDLVVVVDSGEKGVSSSEAHLRVKSSPLWEGRIDRVQERLRYMMVGLREGDWKTVSALAWTEFWEMHSLFHTARDFFTYWKAGTMEVLEWLEGKRRNRRLIVTMDAGPNVHLIVPLRDSEEWKGELARRFPSFSILESGASRGAEIEAV